MHFTADFSPPIDIDRSITDYHFNHSIEIIGDMAPSPIFLPTRTALLSSLPILVWNWQFLYSSDSALSREAALIHGKHNRMLSNDKCHVDFFPFLSTFCDKRRMLSARHDWKAFCLVDNGQKKFVDYSMEETTHERTHGDRSELSSISYSLYFWNKMTTHTLNSEGGKPVSNKPEVHVHAIIDCHPK